MVELNLTEMGAVINRLRRAQVAVGRARPVGVWLGDLWVHHRSDREGQEQPTLLWWLLEHQFRYPQVVTELQCLALRETRGQLDQLTAYNRSSSGDTNPPCGVPVTGFRR